MLLQLSKFFPFVTPRSPYSLRQSPTHFSCPCVMRLSSLATSFPVLYFISSWLFCDYQFVVFNSLMSSPIFPNMPHIWHPSKMSSISMILSIPFFFFKILFLGPTAGFFLQPQDESRVQTVVPGVMTGLAFRKFLSLFVYWLEGVLQKL